MKNTDMYPDESNWTNVKDQPRSTTPTAQRTRPKFLLIGTSSLVAFMLLVVLVSSLGNDTPSSLRPFPQVVVVKSVGVGTPTPACEAGITYLSVIEGHEQRGEYAQAASTAQMALSHPRLCKDDRPLLANRAVADGYEALVTQEFNPDDIHAQQAVIHQYQELKQLAAEQHVAFPSPFQVAQRSYHIGAFLLVKHVLDDAYQTEAFTPHDREMLTLYVSTLYNLGYWRLKASTPTAQDEGYAYLVASHRIAVRHRTGQAEAWGLLRHYLGDNDARWPQPTLTPLLDTSHDATSLHNGGAK